MNSKRLLAAAIVVAGAFGLPQHARADAIDGEWCGEDGRHLSIQGPAIVTPGGTKMQGAYTRHSFNYSTPANEPDAGQEVAMRLLNETTVQVRTGGPERAAVIWRRCTGRTS